MAKRKPTSDPPADTDARHPACPACGGIVLPGTGYEFDTDGTKRKRPLCRDCHENLVRHGSRPAMGPPPRPRMSF